MTTWPERRAIALTGQLAIVGLVLAEAALAATSESGSWVAAFIPYSAVGALLVIRRPRTSIGWILTGMGFCFALVSVRVTGTASEFADGSVDLSTALFAVVHSGMGTTGIFLYAVLTVVFPSGQLPTGWWGRLARAGLGAGLLLTIASYLLPVVSVSLPTSAWVRNPAALLPDLPIWQVITSTTVIDPVLLLASAGAVSLVVRARHARGTELQQLRWIAASIALVMTAVVAGYVIAALVPGSENGLAWLPATIAFPTVPVAIGIAVLRYHLYDIDRIISRTISYGVVTLTLVAVYAGLILLLQAPLGAVTGGDTIAVAASTLVAAGLFQPLRRRIQGAVDRRFNRSRYDAEQTATTLAAELRDEIDPGRVRSAVLAAVDSAIKPQGVAVWIRGEGR